MADTSISLDFEQPIIELEEKIASLRSSSQDGKVDLSAEITVLEQKCQKLKNDIYGSLTSWQRVQLARHPKRPYMMDYVNMIFTDFVELHGDRSYADDKAIVSGVAVLDGRPVAIIGQQKGRTLAENLELNFGMAHPEGYRKALRIMKLAEKFGRPVITFIDTPGAYPGIGAEERGQAEAIARNLREMADLRVPIVSIVIGEGGSGGALGIGVSNRLLMLENAYYSVITPEGCAAILFRDAAKAPAAAAAMKITAKDLQQLGVIDEIVAEPLGGAHCDPSATGKNIREALLRHVDELSGLGSEALFNDRYAKYRRMGVFVETASSAVKAGSAAKPGKKKKAAKK